VVKEIVITGGPGCGKTTILGLLAQMSGKEYCGEIEVISVCGEEMVLVPESARRVIKKHQAKGVEEPWSDRVAFQTEIILDQILLEQKAKQENGVFIVYDRGRPDGWTYCLLDGKKAPEVEKLARRNYDLVVFLEMPPKTLYESDLERSEDYETAMCTMKWVLKSET